MANITENQFVSSKDLPKETQDIYTKYNESMQFLLPRKKRQALQIALLNNLNRGEENISSTLLLTLFNRTVSNHYDPSMQIRFVPAEEMEQKQIQSLNILAENDHREMDMAKLGYDWLWDALFFGRGYMDTLRFDAKRKIMRPSVINPLAFGYDPFFENVQDWRYYWKWITKSSVELNRLIKAGVIKGVKDASEISSGVDQFLWDYKVIKERAKFTTPQADDSQSSTGVGGDIHQILEYYGYDNDGDKAVYWVDKYFTRILFKEKLDLRDGEDIVGPNNQIIKTDSKWPIVVKESFREPHSSVNFSVADLLEDKHRARSVLLNLAYLAAKDKANPLYVYNKDMVEDVSQLLSRQIYQHIPVTDVERAIAPLNTDTAMDPSLQVFMQIMNQEASDPIGANLQEAPKQGEEATATEAAINQQLADLAQSLQSKVLQQADEEFWSHWYCRYKRNVKAGDEKMATIVGVKGVTFEKIMLADVLSKYPPGVKVYSAKEAEYKELVERRDLMEILPVLQTSLTPDGLRNFYKYVFLPKFQSLDPQTIDVLLPDSIDETKATQENELLDDNRFILASAEENHEQHLAVHAQSKNTWAKFIHMQMHEELLSEQKKMMMAQGMQQMQPQQAETQGEPAMVGAGQQSPLSAAASLRDKTLQDIGQKRIEQ